MISVGHSTVEGACGVGVVFCFEDTGVRKKDYWGSYYRSAVHQNNGGAGWVCAGFVENDPLSDEVFQQMFNKYKLVFKTPTRLNKNSSNPFYFAVFDTEGVDIPQGFDEVDD